MKCSQLILAAAFAAVPLSISSAAEEIVTNPVGFNKVTIPAGQKTRVTVPFLRQPLAFQGKILEAVSAGGNLVQLNAVGAVNWSVNGFPQTHYVRFVTGEKTGSWYEITANTSNSVTIDPAGDALLSGPSQLAADDQFTIVPYWTLDALFPPGDQTTVHVSSTSNLGDRATEVILPNLGVGTNLPPGPKFFLLPSGWVADTVGNPTAGDAIIPPGSSFVIQHPAHLAATTFTPDGLVLMIDEVLPLATQPSARQDNEVGILRPVPITLEDSLLADSFVPSVGHLVFQRRDALFVFRLNDEETGFTTTAYYRYLGNWIRDEGMAAANPVANSDELPPGAGLLVRKAASATGLSAMWLNPPAYGDEVATTGLSESEGEFESFSQVSETPGSTSEPALRTDAPVASVSTATVPTLTAKQRASLRRIVTKRDPSELGLNYRRWSKRAINAVVEKRFGITSPDPADRKFLQRLGSTPAQAEKDAQS